MIPQKISTAEKKKLLEIFFSKPKKVMLRLFILVMLLDKEEHGYNIKKKIEENTLKTWAPSNYLVYGELNQLEKEGLIVSRREHKGEVPLKKYNITKGGREELFSLAIAIVSIFDFGKFGIDLEFPLKQDGFREWLEEVGRQPIEAQVEQLEKIQRATEIFLATVKHKLDSLKE